MARVVKVTIRVIRYEGGARGAQPITVREWKELPLLIRVRYNWYFRLIAAHEQIIAGKKAVELTEYRHEFEETPEQALVRLKRELGGYRSQLSKWKRIIQEIKDNPEDLFGIENHPNYQKALAKISMQEMKCRRVEDEIQSIAP